MSQIKGPLGIWTWPILNTLVTISADKESSDTKSVEQAKIIRDSNGEVQEIVVIKE